MSYTTLCQWLKTEESTGLATQLTAERIASYSKIFDQLAVIDGHQPSLGLEHHHDLANELDLSLKGGLELLKLKDIRYPRWLIDLARSMEDNIDFTKLRENTFYVEFDQGPDSFSLAGFFRSFSALGGDGETTSYQPAMDYLALLDKFRGCDSKSSQCLSEFVNNIGYPAWIGVMTRGGNVVKLIALLSKHNIETAKTFCSNSFSQVFNDSCISIDTMFLEIQECLPQLAIRVSLDLDLDRDIFLPRFSLEVAPAMAGKEAMDWPQSLIRLMDCLQISNNATSDLQKLFKILPRGIKRPTNFMSGEVEKLYCSYYHLKTSTTSSGSTIKSYIGAHYLKE
jgi:hypothetical protein